mmetsp:Transcript_77877/g.216358  ORF Transcript_77877/g.216358 Transcript_77877/m.216358 type:complete len:333 (+) Transcript_77877:109-1107(+)
MDGPAAWKRPADVAFAEAQNCEESYGQIPAAFRKARLRTATTPDYDGSSWGDAGWQSSDWTCGGDCANGYGGKGEGHGADADWSGSAGWGNGMTNWMGGAGWGGQANAAPSSSSAWPHSSSDAAGWGYGGGDSGGAWAEGIMHGKASGMMSQMGAGWGDGVGSWQKASGAAKGSSGFSKLSAPMAQQAQPAPGVVLTQSQEDQGGERRYSGRIKKMFDLPGNNGYGFIECPETKMRYGYDVYIHQKQFRGCSMGDEVSFTIVRNAKGEPQARNVMRAEDAAKIMAKQQREQKQREEALHQKRVASLANISPATGNLMDEEQAKNFQKSLRSR